MSNLVETTNREDYALVDRFISGDQGGFEMLVKKYQNYVVNTVYSISGDAQIAEDIAQDVFIKVYQKLGSFEKKSAFSTWLYRITVNSTYNYLKSRKRYVPLDDIKEKVDFTETSITALDKKEKQEIVKKAIDRLSFKYRIVLVLKDIEGLSYKDIAQAVGCRIGTVESRLFRARSLLKKILLPLLSKEAEI